MAWRTEHRRWQCRRRLRGRALVLALMLLPVETIGQGDPHFSVINGAALHGDSLVVAGQFSGPLRLGKYGFWSQRRAGFLASFDPKGRVVWAQEIDGSGDDDISAVTVLDDSDVLIAGKESEEVAGTDGRLTGRHHRRVFLSRYTAKGKRVWVRTMPEGATSIGTMAAAANGDFFIGGCFSGDSFDLGVGPIENAFRPPARVLPRGAPPLPDSAQTDGFVARLRHDGTALWSRRVGGLSQDCVGSLAVDPAGALYAGITVYGPTKGEPPVPSTGSHVLILKLAPNSGSIDWYFTNHDQYIARGLLFRLAADRDAVYFAGSASHLPDIGSLKSNPNGNGFVGALDSSDGSLRWAQVISFRIPYGWVPVALGSRDRVEIAFHGRRMPLAEDERSATWLLALTRDSGRQLSLRKLGQVGVKALGLQADGRMFWAGAEKGRLARGVVLP